MAVLHHVAHVDADAKDDSTILGRVLVGRSHRFLNLGHAANGVDDTGKLNQKTVAGSVGNAAPVLGDKRVGDFGTVGTQRPERAFFVNPDEPREANNISGHNRRQSADLTRCRCQPPWLAPTLRSREPEDDYSRPTTN